MRAKNQDPRDGWRDRLVRLTRRRTSAWAPDEPFLFVRPATSLLTEVLICRTFATQTTGRDWATERLC